MRDNRSVVEEQCMKCIDGWLSDQPCSLASLSAA
jgi:hypothetical protein